MVATEVWLATGHRGSSQARPWCAHDGNSLGSTWALGLRRLRSTPLIRVQIASSGSTCGPRPCAKRSEEFVHTGPEEERRRPRRS